MFYFRCKANPTAPLLALDSFWEADEMKGHPDYERVDEAGEAIVDESANAPTRISFQMAGGKRRAK